MCCCQCTVRCTGLFSSIQSNPIPAVLPATLMPIVPESQQAASMNSNNFNNNNGNGFNGDHVSSVGAFNNDSSSVSSLTTTTATTTTTKAVSPLRPSIPLPASQHKATQWTNDLCSTTAKSTVTASRLQTQAQNQDTTYSYRPPRHVCSNPVSLQKTAEHFGNLPLQGLYQSDRLQTATLVFFYLW